MPDLQYRKVQLQYKCCRIRDFLSINSWWVNSWINSFGMDRYGMCPLEQPKLERLPLLCSKEWFLKSYWVAIEAICGPALERELQRTGTDIYSVRSISIVWIISLRWGFVYCTLRGNPAEELKAPGCVKFCRSKEHMKILKRHGRFPLTWISHISVYIGHILASNKLPVLVLFCSN